ncbi:zinc finger protein 652 isoform X2 [Copidosoma floridanum]|uniref:zinc finger protein 652 isoform X2 n=1 Tax=Copidosoma floridanum TaxID=29053 RepID=UPI000C6F68F2|nr:zinc finger protein 652 isoform X2 [Copidosoma floridanum]
MMSQRVCCRTCLAECGDLVPIFSGNSYVDNLPDKLLSTIRIEVQKDDKLPKMICKKCIFLVDSLHCFKDQCEMAEIKLKQSLQNSLPSFKNVGQLLNTVEDNDPAAFQSSSEDEYHVEYVSEEARIEYENTKKQRYKSKQDHKKSSGVKVKSVEILPSESKENIYKNLSAIKYECPTVKEEANLSDFEERSSVILSDDSCKYSSKYSRKPPKNRFYDTEYVKEEIVHVDESVARRVTKRRTDDEDMFSQSLSKVPKKVVFKEEDEYIDEDLHYMEITNQSVSTPIVVEDSSPQYNSVEEKTYETGNVPKVRMNSLPSIPPNEEYQNTLENRMNVVMKYATLNFPEICTICSGSFESHTEVLKHKLECHLKPDQTNYFCPICHESFSSNRDLVDHIYIHEDIHCLICVFCSNCFYTEESLRRHLRDAHVNLRKLKCQKCPKQFYQFQAILYHLRTHVTDAYLTCMICPLKFNDKESLQIHINKEHGKHLLFKPSKCETCGMRLSKKELVEHIMMHPSHLCRYCKKGFIKKELLREHIATHETVEQEQNQQPSKKHHFDCYLCTDSFVTIDERTQHMQEQHMQIQEQCTQSTEVPCIQPAPEQLSTSKKVDTKKFRCRVCHKIIVSQKTYIAHLKNVHTNSKQTSEILRELSESLINERRNEQHNKSNNSFEFT